MSFKKEALQTKCFEDSTEAIWRKKPYENKC